MTPAQHISFLYGCIVSTVIVLALLLALISECSSRLAELENRIIALECQPESP